MVGCLGEGCLDPAWALGVESDLQGTWPATVDRSLEARPLPSVPSWDEWGAGSTAMVAAIAVVRSIVREKDREPGGTMAGKVPAPQAIAVA